MDECFLCGKRVGADYVGFQIASNIAPKAKAHRDCVNVRDSLSVSRAYHRWVGDINNIARAHMGSVIPNY